MRSFFKELFEYNFHCNQQLLKAFMEQEGKIPVKSVELFTHIVFAHHTWVSRIKNTNSTFGIWGKLPAVELKELDNENYRVSLSILGFFEFEDLVSYRNSTGEIYTNTFRDILFHVINHSNYHRGQIARDLRLSGLEPLATDYIFHKRRAL